MGTAEVLCLLTGGAAGVRGERSAVVGSPILLLVGSAVSSGASGVGSLGQSSGQVWRLPGSQRRWPGLLVAQEGAEGQKEGRPAATPHPHSYKDPGGPGLFPRPASDSRGQRQERHPSEPRGLLG